MELWYSEMHTEDVKFSIRIKEQLLADKSEFQQIDVFDSGDLEIQFGNPRLALDIIKNHTKKYLIMVKYLLWSVENIWLL